MTRPACAGNDRSGGNMSEHGNETEERRVVLTESAARRIAVLKEQERSKTPLCGSPFPEAVAQGFQYGFTFDDQRNGRRIIVPSNATGSASLSTKCRSTLLERRRGRFCRGFDGCGVPDSANLNAASLLRLRQFRSRSPWIAGPGAAAVKKRQLERQFGQGAAAACCSPSSSGRAARRAVPARDQVPGGRFSAVRDPRHRATASRSSGPARL